MWKREKYIVYSLNEREKYILYSLSCSGWFDLCERKKYILYSLNERERNIYFIVWMKERNI